MRQRGGCTTRIQNLMLLDGGEEVGGWGVFSADFSGRQWQYPAMEGTGNQDKSVLGKKNADS